MSALVLLFVVLVLLIFKSIHSHFLRRYTFWKERDVPFLEPQFPVGNVGDTLKSTIHFAHITDNLYRRLKHHGDYAGIYFFRDPVLMVLSPEFAKTVLVKDFNYFVDRGVYSNEKDDPLSANLFFMEGHRWRKLRALLTPTFTSGRLKAMFHTILAVGEQFDRYLTDYTADKREVEVKDLLARFTTDIIGSCAFGIDCNSLENPKSQFREMGKRMINFPKLKALRIFFAMMFRDKARKLGIRFNDADVSEFFMGVVRDTIRYREENNVQRKDFMQLLIDLKNKGHMEGDKPDEEQSPSGSPRLTFEEIAAQAFVFFFAGFETSATTMTFVLHLLASHQDVQEKGRKCVLETLAKHNGQFTYDSLMEMNYIDCIINETLRIYPPVATLHRMTNKPYKLPNGAIIPEKTGIVIPNLAIQRDPDYFPDPLAFRPERFFEESKEQRHHFCHLPFGEGPRICIGMRFGLLQTRMGIAMLLRSYRFSFCSKSIDPVPIDPVNLIHSPAGEIWLGIEKISAFVGADTRLPNMDVAIDISGRVLTAMYNSAPIKLWYCREPIAFRPGGNCVRTQVSFSANDAISSAMAARHCLLSGLAIASPVANALSSPSRQASVMGAGATPGSMNFQSWSRRSKACTENDHDGKMWIYLLITVISLAVWFVRNKYGFWKRHGVPYIQPRFPFGNIQGVGRRMHSSQLMTRYYNQMKGKHPYGGIFFFTNPVALALDLEFVKDVLVRDFQYFHDRGVYYNEKDDPISGHLFNIEGTKWTNLRRKLIPTFSSGKMKMMCPTIVEVGERFGECVTRCIAQDEEIEMKDLLARFTTDVIGSCAFGIDCNSLNDPDVEFRRVGKKVFELPPGRLLKFFFMGTFKDFSRRIHIKGTADDVSEFFFKVVRETIEYREKNNVQRNDFMNLLMQLKDKGELDDDSGELVGTLSFNEVVAQAFVFFLGGFETSSTTMSYCLYELSLHEDIQERARQCVRDAVKKHGGMNYDAVMDMDYIEQCVNESLRKYPPGANLIRSVTKDYQVPNSKVIFTKGMSVMIPVYAIHHDPEYYPEPEKFDPDRFSQENCANRKPFTFMPFGEGPRICIAARFGLLETKIGLATLLMNFKFSRCSKSVVPLVISSKHAVLTPSGGLWLKVEKLEQ
ncbi:uncharacterized protein LOC129741148 [Uranotaenia lowii]|uniref:uncharacterized protein LOC129741148 n=1 Tax=Uranotaenia lowii TaxID=190385 RepID=UPI00247A3188|nr:uncharacterized protein LOC129741148 [Uranotaenia lowii]